MEAGLPSYRLFKFDPDNKGRAPGEWIEAEDDDVALEAARVMANGMRCEVWLQTRLVGVIAGGERIATSGDSSSLEVR